MTNGEKFKDVFGFGADGSRVIAVNSTWWDCDFQRGKPKTNGDRLRAMSDEELAKQIAEWNQGDCPTNGDCPETQNSFVCEPRKCWLDWLRQEADT